MTTFFVHSDPSKNRQRNKNKKGKPFSSAWHILIKMLKETKTRTSLKKTKQTRRLSNLDEHGLMIILKPNYSRIDATRNEV